MPCPVGEGCRQQGLLLMGLGVTAWKGKCRIREDGNTQQNMEFPRRSDHGTGARRLVDLGPGYVLSDGCRSFQQLNIRGQQRASRG